MTTPATYARDGDVGAITLASPPLNLFDAAMSEALVACIGEAEADSPRALIIRAEGRVFTGGVDVHEFEGLSVDQAEQLAIELLAISQRIESLPFPVIAVVHALCLTAGFEVSLACDIILAAESARFGLVERVVGVTPFMGGTQRIAQRAGPARARELVMTGALFDASTLERWNVVNRVYPDTELEGAARDFARDLAAGPTVAMAATKAIVKAQAEGGTAAADEVTPAHAAPLYATEDLRNAVRSFLADGPGKATFEGR